MTKKKTSRKTKASKKKPRSRTDARRHRFKINYESIRFDEDDGWRYNSRTKKWYVHAQVDQVLCHVRTVNGRLLDFNFGWGSTLKISNNIVHVEGLWYVSGSPPVI